MKKWLNEKSIDNLNLFLIFFAFCGYFGHSNITLLYKIPFVIVFLINIMASIYNYFLYKKINRNILYYICWSGTFLFLLFSSLLWTKNVDDSLELIKGMILSVFYICSVLSYVTNKEKLIKVLKLLVFSYIYMCLIILIFETSSPWTAEFGTITGLYFNRIATILSYGILITFYLYHKESKFIYLLPIILFYYVIFLTGSRKGILMPIVFIILFLILKAGKNRKKIIKNVFLLITCFLILFPIICSNTYIKNRIDNLVKTYVFKEYVSDNSIKERSFFINEAIKVFKKNPILGIGANGFRSHLIQINYKGIKSYSHCNFTELLATLGIIGFILYYSIYVYIILKTIKNYKSNNLDAILILSYIITEVIFEYGFVSYYMFEFQLVLALLFILTRTLNKKENILHKKLKVVTMITSLSTGGSERTAVSLANWLANNGEDSYLINLGINDNNYKIDSKVKVYNKEIGKNIFEKVKNFVKVLIYLQKIKPDVIFEMLFKPLKYAWINKILNPKVVIIGSERNNPQKYKSLKYKFFCYVAPIFCDGYIFQTERIKSKFLKSIQLESIVIGNALSNPDAYIIDRTNKRKNVIATTGKMHYQKGQDTLIKAFKKLNEKYPNYKLIIYGDGEERNNLELLVKNLNLNGKVIMPGKKKQYLKELAECEIFIMTSRYEGMPNALMEAMAIGMPCISTDCIAGPSEIIKNGENGLLVKVDDIDEIANKLIYLVENKNVREKMAKEAKKVRDIYSQDKIYKKFVNYFYFIYAENNY